MDLTQLANLGEFIGGVAVLVTLVYLAVQMRQNVHQVSEQNRFATWSEVARAFDEFRKLVAGDRALTSIWLRGRENLRSLDQEERLRFDYLALQILWTFARMPLLGRQEYLEANILEKGMASLPVYAGGPGMEEWWHTSEYQAQFPPKFVAFVDANLPREEARA